MGPRRQRTEPFRMQRYPSRAHVKYCESNEKVYAQKAFDGLAKRVLRAFYETVKRVSKECLAEDVQ